jgi:hypothetical protein
MWKTIDNFNKGDIVKVMHCGDGSTSIAKIIDGFCLYTIKILEGTEKGRTYDVSCDMAAQLISER